METIVLKHTVQKQAEGQYYTLPFEVPSGVEKLTVSYSYQRIRPGGGSLPNKVNVIDLGLEDADNRFLGWSGSARSSVSVGQFDSTNGYLMEPVKPGTWHILVGAYRVPPQGLQVEYRVEFTSSGPCWLFGDLHMHSDASDGQHSIHQLVEMARAMGLDYMAVANHNNYAENLNLPVVAGLTLIPAVEWTHYKGHMNFFGAQVPFKNSFEANSAQDMARILQDAKAAGALISVNHPKCSLCPYVWEDEACFDTVEVWNGPMRQDNLNAIAWWDGMLRQGRRLSLVGGSDFHRSGRVVRLGRPATAVYAASRAVPDILAGIAAGRSYVTQHVGGVRLRLECGEQSFGQTGPPQGEIVFEAENCPAGTRLSLVTDAGEVMTLSARGGRVDGSAPVGSARYAYLVARRLSVVGWRVCAISNPIYFER